MNKVVYHADVIIICRTKSVVKMKYKHYGCNMAMKYTKYVIITKSYAFMHILAQHATNIDCKGKLRSLKPRNYICGEKWSRSIDLARNGNSGCAN